MSDTRSERGVGDVTRYPVPADRVPRLDPVAVAEAVPEAVLDIGTATWPAVIDQVRLIPTLWLSVQQLARQVEALSTRVVALERAVAASEVRQ